MTDEMEVIRQAEMDKAIGDVVDRLVRDSQQAQKDGCCLQPSWRGHLCQYHQGYEDGADRALRLTGYAP